MLVVAAVIARRGRILACQRSRNGQFPLKWEFPGGKVQDGESPPAALARELHEELGVRVKIGEELFRARHQYAEMNDSVELIFLAAQIPTNWEIENRLFEKIAWIPPRQLPQMDFLEADRALILQLATGAISASTLAL